MWGFRRQKPIVQHQRAVPQFSSVGPLPGAAVRSPKLKGLVPTLSPHQTSATLLPGRPQFKGPYNTPPHAQVQLTHQNNSPHSGKHSVFTHLLERTQLRKSQVEETHRALLLGHGGRASLRPDLGTALCVHQPSCLRPSCSKFS